MNSAFFGNIYIVVEGREIAYVQETSIFKENDVRTLRIGHFATASDMQRLGVGKALADALRLKVADAYQVKRIIFDERIARAHDASFFTSLGAVEIPQIGGKSPSWLWDFSQDQAGPNMLQTADAVELE